MHVTGKTVVVAGGSQGIGLGIARAMAQAGAARLVLIARNTGKLEAAKQTIVGESSSVQVTTLSCDLEDRTELARAHAFIRTTIGVPDVIVCSSARGQFLELAESSWEDFDAAMKSTVFAAFGLVQPFIAEMCQRHSGHIVVVGSPVRRAPFRFVSYKVSRHALHGFAESLRDGLLNTGVGISYVEANRISDSGYFESNAGVGDRLPPMFRDTRFSFLWETSLQVGRRVVRAVQGEKFAVYSFSIRWFAVVSALLPLTWARRLTEG